MENRKLSLLEKEEIQNRVKAMQPEEKEIAVRNLPTSLLNDEFARRIDYANRKVNEVLDLYEKSPKETLDDVEAIIKGWKKILRAE